jgi:hypothetical protein
MTPWEIKWVVGWGRAVKNDVHGFDFITKLSPTTLVAMGCTTNKKPAHVRGSSGIW